jgi:hypothetical protein
MNQSIILIKILSVRASLNTTPWRHVRGVDVQLHAFLTSELEWGESSVSRPGLFIPGERTPVSHWTGGWLVFRAGLDVTARRKNPSPCCESNPGSPSHNLVTILAELLKLRSVRAVILHVWKLAGRDASCRLQSLSHIVGARVYKLTHLEIRQDMPLYYVSELLLCSSIVYIKNLSDA